MREKVQRIQDEGVGTIAEPRQSTSEDLAIECLKRILRENRADLTMTERLVITQRLLRGEGRRGATLGAVGKMLNLSKERVRQIQIAALSKLREVLLSELEPSRPVAARCHAATRATARHRNDSLATLILGLQSNEQAA